MNQLSCNVTNPLIDRLRPSALHLQQRGRRYQAFIIYQHFQTSYWITRPRASIMRCQSFEWTRRCKCAAPGCMSGCNSDSDHVNPVYLITFSNLYYSNVHTYAQQKNLILNYLYYIETQLPQMIYYNKCNLLIIKKNQIKSSRPLFS